MLSVARADGLQDELEMDGIGAPAGVNVIVSGFTRLMYSVAARKALKATTR